MKSLRNWVVRTSLEFSTEELDEDTENYFKSILWKTLRERKIVFKALRYKELMREQDKMEGKK